MVFVWWLVTVGALRLLSSLSSYNRHVFQHSVPLLFWSTYSIGIIFHELCHLVLAVVFGHKIDKVSLKGAFFPRYPAYVLTSYNPRSFYQRLGTLFIAWAPLGVPLAGMFAFYEWGYEHTTGWTWGVVVIAFLASIHCMDLSKEDWIAAMSGLPVMTLLVVPVVAWLWPVEGHPLSWPVLDATITVFLAIYAMKFALIVILSLLFKTKLVQ